jgi:hypothetical protein
MVAVVIFEFYHAPRGIKQVFAETINDGFFGNGGLEQKSPYQTKLRIRLGR